MNDTLCILEEHYRTMVEKAGEAIVVLQDGFYKFANPTAVHFYGYLPSKLSVIPFSQLVHPDDRKMVMDCYEKIMRGAGQKEKHTYRVITGDGRLKWVEEGSVAITWEGQPAVLSLLCDVTAQKKKDEELQVKKNKLRALSTRLLQIQEQERRRLSRELHDEIGQALTVIKLELQMYSEEIQPVLPEVYAKIKNTVAYLDAVLERVRVQAFSLRPPALEHMGLVEAVSNMAEGFSRRTGLSVTVKAEKYRQRLPENLETELYRCVQEALTNVAKHARAGSVQVTLAQGPAEAWVEVQDDGAGFDPALLGKTASAEHIGLIGMQERAELLGGSLSIDSRPGGGTVLRIRVPLPDVHRGGKKPCG